MGKVYLRGSGVATALGVVLLTSIPQGDARAYCVTKADVITFWSNEFPDMHVPVWINVSTDHSIANTGPSADDVARLLREMIARHNESVASPKLYFAGFTTKAYDPTLGLPAANMPSGITILSATCEEAIEDPVCGMDSKDAKGCGNFATRGIYGSPGSELDPLGWVYIAPIDCPGVNTEAWSISEYPDLAHALLHEIGHTLGLQHSNRPKPVCEAGNYIHGNSPQGTNGVMQTALPGNFAAARAWRRDDLEGLTHVYGAAADALEIAWWDDVDYPDYPHDTLGQSLVGMDVSRSVAVSNQRPSGFQALATTAPSGRVLHRLFDAAGDATPALADAIVDPSPSGLTWAMPAVAIGHKGAVERVFVAWMADEHPEGNLVSLRAALRSVDSLDWTHANHPEELRVNRVAAGFVPDPEVFLITTLVPSTSEIRLLLFDIDGAPLGSAITLEDLQAFDVGAPLCEGTRCLIPWSESMFGGPNYGIVEVEIDALTPSASVIDVEIEPPLDTRGRLSLLDDTLQLLGGTGERRFMLGDYPGFQPDPAALQNNPNSEWPVGLGLWTEGDSVQGRIFAPRAVICGNGIVQAGEDCDDANDIAADSCDACVRTDAEAGDESGFADLGGESESACECRTSGEPGSPLAGPLMLLSAWALRCRSRQPSSRRPSSASHAP